MLILSIFLLLLVIIIAYDLRRTSKKLAKLKLDHRRLDNWVLGLGIITGILLVVTLFIHFRTDIFTQNTGVMGDTIGGVTSPFVNGLSAFLVYLALKAQIDANKLVSDQFEKQQAIDTISKIEMNFFELIKLHRNNVDEIEYSVFEHSGMVSTKSRHVFKIISDEFIQCYHEVKKIAKVFSDLEIIQPQYRIKLEQIKKNNSCRCTVEELALIDITYCILYFGLSEASETTLLHKFYHRYNKSAIIKIKQFLSLKPKREKVENYANWTRLRELPKVDLKLVLEEIYSNSPHVQRSDLAEILIPNLHLDRFYSGHQFRLGHYFRHLFQAFRYLSSQKKIDRNQKYFLGKTMRAQLSTYEQFLLFVNSLSSLGMSWEFDLVDDNLKGLSQKELKEYRMITKYHLVKNLPGSAYYDITFRRFYGNVKYEYLSDLTYRS